MGQTGVNAYSLSLLLGAEPGQVQEDTEDARATPSPGKHAQLCICCIYCCPQHVYEIKCVPENERNH